MVKWMARICYQLVIICFIIILGYFIVGLRRSQLLGVNLLCWFLGRIRFISFKSFVDNMLGC
jgi:hypothetical protein